MVQKWKRVHLFLGYRFRAATLLLALELATPGPGRTNQLARGSVKNDAAQTKQPAAVGPTTQFQNQAIPLANIADRAEQLELSLREMNAQIPSGSELSNVEQTLRIQAHELKKRSRLTSGILASSSPPLELEDQQRYWRSRARQYELQRRALTSRAATLEEQIHYLDSQQVIWLATRQRVQETPGLQALVERVDQELNDIDVARSRIEEHLSRVLTLQNQVAQDDQQIWDILARLGEARKQTISRIFERTGHPLWQIKALHQMDQPRPRFRDCLVRPWAETREFLGSHKVDTLVLAMIFCWLLLSVFRIRRHFNRDMPSAPPQTVSVLRAPFSIALLIALIGISTYIASVPSSIIFVSCLILVGPVLRLLPPIVSTKTRPLLYCTGILYVFEGFYLLAQLPQLFARTSYALLTLAAVGSFAWLARRLHTTAGRTRDGRILRVAILINLVVLLTSLGANILGFVTLAQMLGICGLVAPFVGVSLYCAVRVVTILLAVLLGTDPIRTSVGPHSDVVQRWVARALVTIAALLWARVTLHLLTLYDSILSALSTLLYYPIGLERAHFTIGTLFGIGSILLGGYALAKALVFLLNRLMLPKLHLQRGVPYAISTITYYLLLIVVLVAGLSAVGVELNKFTVLTGALGVGLGFGLQNIVNNFVSGVILLLERPIHVGDTVDVGGLVGTVRRIGARSSTVLTFEGAEVIVPNSNLLSNQVINWTLSSQWRRIDIPVRVAYGTDPEQMIALLTQVAEAHPGVLLERPPVAFFTGLGENALNFELRFWCSRQDMWFQLQSDVTISVVKALRHARIEIPVPQRDLHVRSVATSVRDAVSGTDVEASFARKRSEPDTFNFPSP